MEEINLKDLFNYYMEKLFHIIIITSVVVMIGFIYGVFIQKPKYESSTSLILTGFSNSSEDGSINTNDLSINQKLLATYQQITTSRKVLNQVIEELDLDYNVTDLASKINVTSIADTEIIKITVADKKPNLAYKITSKIAKVFSNEVKEIYNVSNVSILDEAEIPEQSSNIGIFKILIISIILGLFISCVYVFILFYFDTTIKNVEQIEERFDIPILGTVPDFNSKNRKRKNLWMN